MADKKDEVKKGEVKGDGELKVSEAKVEKVKVEPRHDKHSGLTEVVVMKEIKSSDHKDSTYHSNG